MQSGDLLSVKPSFLHTISSEVSRDPFKQTDRQLMEQTNTQASRQIVSQSVNICYMSLKLMAKKRWAAAETTQHTGWLTLQFHTPSVPTNLDILHRRCRELLLTNSPSNEKLPGRSVECHRVTLVKMILNHGPAWQCSSDKQETKVHLQRQEIEWASWIWKRIEHKTPSR